MCLYPFLGSDLEKGGGSHSKGNTKGKRPDTVKIKPKPKK